MHCSVFDNDQNLQIIALLDKAFFINNEKHRQIIERFW